MLRGRRGNDTLFGGPQRDQLFGDEGVDFLIGGRANDVLNGGAGNIDVCAGGHWASIAGGSDFAIAAAQNGDTFVGCDDVHRQATTANAITPFNDDTTNGFLLESLRLAALTD